jgi:hypothetical protein
MELVQEGWLKQPVAKVRGPIMAGDQGSCRGHHCSKTALTGNLSSKVWLNHWGVNCCPLYWKQIVTTGPVKHGESVRNARAPQADKIYSKQTT